MKLLLTTITSMFFFCFSTEIFSQNKSYTTQPTKTEQKIEKESLIESSIDNFFKYKGVAILAGLAHPTNTFNGGEYIINSNSVLVYIYYKEGYTTVLSINRDFLFFTDVEVIEDDDIFPPFLMVELMKNMVLDLIKDDDDAKKKKSEFENRIDRKFKEMTGKQIAALILTLNYLNY